MFYWRLTSIINRTLSYAERVASLLARNQSRVDALYAQAQCTVTGFLKMPPMPIFLNWTLLYIQHTFLEKTYVRVKGKQWILCLVLFDFFFKERVCGGGQPFTCRNARVFLLNAKIRAEVSYQSATCAFSH